MWVTTHFLERMKQRNHHSKKALKYLLFPHSYEPHKNTFVLVGKFITKLEDLVPDLRCTERMRSNKRRHRP